MVNKGILFLVNNKVLTFAIIILILVAGLVTAPFGPSASFMPRNPIAVDAIPDIGENQQIVYTEWTGQSPQAIEDQITYPLTSNLLGIPGVKSVRSTSMFGFSSVYLIFEDDIDFYWSRSRVSEKLNALPSGLLPQGVQPRLGPDATGLGQIFWYTLEGRDEEGQVTGGWNLQELRSIQDFYVKNALASTKGVSEVASIGGFVMEYQIDVEPLLMKQYGISLQQVVDAVRNSNRDIGAKTLEINQAEYFVRGLGYIASLEDIEQTPVASTNFKSIHIGDIAKVSMGPGERRGILDKGGAEVVGGVVTSRYGANPMEVATLLKDRIKEIGSGLPKKILADGRTSQLTIVPFYDRSVLIKETLDTLGDALIFEILIAILVILVMLRSLRASILISSLLPLAVLMVFVSMKIANVEANIVALSGIAIAIGTMVDMGIILTENIIRHLQEDQGDSFVARVVKATKEVSGAIVTAGLTTIVSFVPVFTLTGAEGKLFFPLAFTKTMALSAAMFITLFVLPPLAALVLKERSWKGPNWLWGALLAFMGVIGVLLGHFWAIILVLLAAIALAEVFGKLPFATAKQWNLVVTLGYILTVLALYWQPLGVGYGFFWNFIFTLFLTAALLVPLHYFIQKYEGLLAWVLSNKGYAIAVPIGLVILGFLAFFATEKEFMPTLKEGDFLLMPTTVPQAGVERNATTLKQLDMAVAAIPEVAYVVGKAGRANSALDPAPMSMFENLISYKPEYIQDAHGRPMRFAVDANGLFKTRTGGAVDTGGKVDAAALIPDKKGKLYRNWRPHIRTEDDIWAEIAAATALPGVTAAPKLQPIETRLVMLQTGMRSAMGIKVRGQRLEDVEAFGLQLEGVLKTVQGVMPSSVFADRITGKPYLIMTIDRAKVARYGLSVAQIQETLEVAVGGKAVGETVEGRERYALRVRYPRELRASPEDLSSILIALPKGGQVPIGDFVEVSYQKGPQSIKSEDGFLVGYVIFDKMEGYSEVTVVEHAEKALQHALATGDLVLPPKTNFTFSGSYVNHLHAQRTLQFVLPGVLLVILFLLYMQFKSLKISLMVFSGVAVTFAGGFLLIWCYGQGWFLDLGFGSLNLRDIFQVRPVHLSVAVWVGFIALFGIATDDGVVMATYLKHSFKERAPQSVEEIRKAVILAGTRRITPCLMTTATTVLALLPILTATGKGANIMIPMAIPCVGGMLMALITLFVVPLLFSWDKELQLAKNKMNKTK